MLKDLGENQSLGVYGNNQYANHLTILKPFDGNTSVSWDQYIPFLFPHGGGHKRALFGLAGGLAASQLHAVPMPTPLSQAPSPVISLGKRDQVSQRWGILTTPSLGYETRCFKGGERMKIAGEGGNVDRNKEKGLKAGKWAKIMSWETALIENGQKSVRERRGIPVERRGHTRKKRKICTQPLLIPGPCQSPPPHTIIFPILSF